MPRTKGSKNRSKTNTTRDYERIERVSPVNTRDIYQKD